MKKRALYILTPGFPSDGNDTTCIPFLQQFVLSLDKQIFPAEVVILTFHYPFISRQYKWNGIEVISFGGMNKSIPGKIFLWLKVMRTLFSMRKKYEALGIFSIWLGECALIGKLMAKIWKCGHYVWIAGQDARKPNRYVRFIRPHEKSLVAISLFVQEQLKTNFGLTPAYIIPNGINPALFQPLKTHGRTISIIGVGSLIPLKNFDLFIEIVEIAIQKTPLTKVLIVGEGAKRQNLEKLIAEKKLQQVIELTGKIDHARVLGFMNDSSIFLHTSAYEGNSTVIHEALYAGCKVVSTVPVYPVTDQNFFHLENKEELANKIVQLHSVNNFNYTRVEGK